MGYTKCGRENRSIIIIRTQQVNLGGWGNNEQSAFQISGNTETSQEVPGNLYESSGKVWWIIPRGYISFLCFQGVSDADGYREEKHIPICETNGRPLL